MIDDEGSPLTDAQLLDRLQAVGAVVVRRGAVESADFPTWRRELRRAARARGMRIAVNQIGGPIVASNPDHVVTDEQFRDAVTRMAMPVTEAPRAKPPRLRVVRSPSDAHPRRSVPPV